MNIKKPNIIQVIKKITKFTFLLTGVFVVWKIVGSASWPWLWVLCPLWITWIFFSSLVSIIWIIVITEIEKGI